VIQLGLPGDAARPLRLLCIGAHSDDIEIGCGGTLLRLLAEHPGTIVHWVVCSAAGARADEARAAAAAFATDAAELHVVLHEFRESHFPWVAVDIKAAFEELKPVRPDLVLTHRRGDEHQDHDVLGRLAWNTFRDHLIAEFEIPKYEGDLGHPNVYVPLSGEVVDRKVELLLEHFSTQRSRTWFRPEVFRALLALRGVECNSPSGFAEAFTCRKVVL
jgi:LmbE family N-acetylglucosaminyl deacetylase